jgi:hypothetical protein
MLKNPPFFPKDKPLTYSSVKNLHVIYEEWGITTKDNKLVPRATIKSSGEEGETYQNLRIIVREVEERTLVFEVINCITFNFSPSDTATILPLWDITEIPFFPGDIEKSGLVEIRRRNKVNVQTSMRRIYRLIDKYGLTQFDSSILLYIHKGLEDIFKRLMRKMGKEFSLLESWEIGSKYRVITPNILEVMYQIDAVIDTPTP